MLQCTMHATVYSRSMKVRRNLDLQLPACLYALITQCSVTQAAERIGMSQPAMRGVARALATARHANPDAWRDPLHCCG